MKETQADWLVTGNCTNENKHSNEAPELSYMLNFFQSLTNGLFFA